MVGDMLVSQYKLEGAAVYYFSLTILGGAGVCVFHRQSYSPHLQQTPKGSDPTYFHVKKLDL